VRFSILTTLSGWPTFLVVIGLTAIATLSAVFLFQWIAQRSAITAAGIMFLVLALLAVLFLGGIALIAHFW
jgi:hypothetical protein